MALYVWCCGPCFGVVEAQLFGGTPHIGCVGPALGVVGLFFFGGGAHCLSVLMGMAGTVLTVAWLVSGGPDCSYPY